MKQYALVRPESKLWIGWFDAFIHALIHHRKLADEGWYIVRRSRRVKPDGWLKLGEPCALRETTVNGSGYGYRGSRTVQPATRWTRTRYGTHGRG